MLQYCYTLSVLYTICIHIIKTENGKSHNVHNSKSACLSNRFVLFLYAPNYWVIGIELNSTKYIRALNSFILILEYWDGWLLNVTDTICKKKTEETAVREKKVYEIKLFGFKNWQ